MEGYCILTKDNNILYYTKEYEQNKTDIWTVSKDNAPSDAKATFENLVFLNYNMFCTNFSTAFKKFTFDKTDQTYKFNGVKPCFSVENPTDAQKQCESENGHKCPHEDYIITNSLYEQSETLYYYATVKIVNGNLDYISA